MAEDLVRGERYFPRAARLVRAVVMASSEMVTRFMRALRGFLSTRDLLGDDNLAEVVIHIRPDLSRKVYVSKLQGTPEMLAKIVEGVVRSGTDLGHQHGVTLNLSLPMAGQNPQGQWIKDAPTPLGIVLQFQPPIGGKP